jgi:hypothetical protein
VGGVKPPITTGYSRTEKYRIVAHNAGIYHTQAGCDQRGTLYLIPHGLPARSTAPGPLAQYVPTVNLNMSFSAGFIGGGRADRGFVLSIEDCDDQYIKVWGSQLTGAVDTDFGTHSANDVAFSWSCYFMVYDYVPPEL